MEDYFRATVNQSSNHGKGFLDILPPEETIEVVKLHKHLNPEDFDSPLFNNIMAGKNHPAIGLANYGMNQLSLEPIF